MSINNRTKYKFIFLMFYAIFEIYLKLTTVQSPTHLIPYNE